MTTLSVAVVLGCLLCGLIAALVACGMESRSWWGSITCWVAAAFLTALLVFSIFCYIAVKSA